MNNNFKIFNSFDLKIIALLTMIIDHLGEIFFPNFFLLRIIGRISFIIYAFLISEGVIHSKNLKNYLSKLLLWAFISELPFDYAFFGKIFYWDLQNIFFTLFISVLALSSLKLNINSIFKFLILFSAPFIAHFLKFDYGWYGVLVIYAFYLLKCHFLYKYLLIFSFSITFATYAFFAQFFSFLGFIPVALYNGKLGRKFGNIYYSFYALHLIFFGILKYYLRI